MKKFAKYWPASTSLTEWLIFKSPLHSNCAFSGCQWTMKIGWFFPTISQFIVLLCFLKKKITRLLLTLLCQNFLLSRSMKVLTLRDVIAQKFEIPKQYKNLRAGTAYSLNELKVNCDRALVFLFSPDYKVFLIYTKIKFKSKSLSIKHWRPLLIY